MVRAGHAPWRLQSIRADARLHTVDLTDQAGLAKVVAAVRPEWVFHLATHGAYSSQRDPRTMVGTNLVGTLNLLEPCLAAGFEAFVNTGSSSEYGWKDHAPSEGEPLEPGSHYAITKAAATWLCRYHGQLAGAPVSTLRLYSVYGPWETASRLVPALIVRGLEGKLPPLAGPAVARDFVHVDDVVEACLAAARSREPGAVYNVGTGTQTTLRAVVEVARRELSIKAEPEWGAFQSRPWDTDVWVADPRKIERDLGWRARYSFAEGFRATVAWLRDQPDMLAAYRSMSS